MRLSVFGKGERYGQDTGTVMGVSAPLFHGAGIGGKGSALAFLKNRIQSGRLLRRGLPRFCLLGSAAAVMLSFSRFPFRQQILDLVFIAREAFGVTHRFRSSCSFTNLAAHSYCAAF